MNSWLFLLEGLITLLIGIASFFLMPASAVQTKTWFRPKGWFTDRDLSIVVNRVLRDDPSKGITLLNTNNWHNAEIDFAINRGHAQPSSNYSTSTVAFSEGLWLVASTFWHEWFWCRANMLEDLSHRLRLLYSSKSSYDLYDAEPTSAWI